MATAIYLATAALVLVVVVFESWRAEETESRGCLLGGAASKSDGCGREEYYEGAEKNVVGGQWSFYRRPPLLVVAVVLVTSTTTTTGTRVV